MLRYQTEVMELLNEYLRRIQAIIAELHAQLDGSNLPDKTVAQIRAYLDQMQCIVEQNKEP